MDMVIFIGSKQSDISDEGTTINQQFQTLLLQYAHEKLLALD